MPDKPLIPNLGVVGKKIGPLRRNYTSKDVILYALAIGAGFDDLSYCYEKGLKVIPSFPLAAMMAFFWQVVSTANLTPEGVLHGEQSLIIHDEIPPEGSFITSGQITRIYDMGRDKGALVEATNDTEDINGRRLVTSGITIFARLNGGFGGNERPSIKCLFPGRPPDMVVRDAPRSNQPLLYRLTGDLFPLHADPEFAKKCGYDHPVMHGLCTYGFACRALISQFLKSKTDKKIRRIDCRFSRPLYPGEPIETQIWRISSGNAMWKTINAQTGKAVITNGILRYR